MSEPRADPVPRMLHARRLDEEADALGRTRWKLTWAEGPEGLSQPWHGTLDELTEMAARCGFAGVQVTP